jgi:alpha-ketoglutarate-dependent taurine dioxygenase
MLRARKLSETPIPAGRSLRPFGRIVTADVPGQSLLSLPVWALRDLARQEGVLVLRGFAPLGRDELVEYASSWGDILNWNFGPVLELIVQEEPRNYLFTNGSVPFHWDGAFAAAVPEFQLFHCLQAPLPGTGGETLFCDTGRIWLDASPERRRRWHGLTFTYATEKLAHYGGRISAPLVSRHPRTFRRVVRFNEPPNTETADLNPLAVGAAGVPEAEFPRLVEELRVALYDPRYCYAHAWVEGDYLVADNFAMLHGRRAYRAHSPRHLRRIHVL